MDETTVPRIGRLADVAKDPAARVIAGVVVVALALLGVIYYFGDDEDDIRRAKIGEREQRIRRIEEAKMAAPTKARIHEERGPGAARTPGSYETYSAARIADARRGRVVLFFRAPWCPTCNALDADIREHLSDIPSDVTILDVDYDREADLRKTYGVVTQHTLVLVDADGGATATWVGSMTLSDLLSQIR